MTNNHLVTQGTNLKDILAMIAMAALAESTKAKYSREIQKCFEAGIDLRDAEALASYAAGLSKSGRSFLKAVLKLWIDRMTVRVKGLATPENVSAVTATIYRLEALNDAIQVKTRPGTTLHTWLTQAEVKKLLGTCGNDLNGERDRVVLALLVGAGLRREELVNLTFDDLQLAPVKDKMRTALNVTGKGAKDRIVPISDELAGIIDRWGRRVSHQGRIVRATTPDERITDSMSAVSIYHVVRKAGQAMGKASLAPHDLRRTFAQLGYEAGVPITQISKLLGHASVATTQKYLNLDLDLTVTVSDFIPLG